MMIVVPGALTSESIGTRLRAIGLRNRRRRPVQSRDSENEPGCTQGDAVRRFRSEDPTDAHERASSNRKNQPSSTMTRADAQNGSDDQQNRTITNLAPQARYGAKQPCESDSQTVRRGLGVPVSGKTQGDEAEQSDGEQDALGGQQNVADHEHEEVARDGNRHSEGERR